MMAVWPPFVLLFLFLFFLGKLCGTFACCLGYVYLACPFSLPFFFLYIFCLLFLDFFFVFCGARICDVCASKKNHPKTKRNGSQANTIRLNSTRLENQAGPGPLRRTRGASVTHSLAHSVSQSVCWGASSGALLTG